MFVRGLQCTLLRDFREMLEHSRETAYWFEAYNRTFRTFTCKMWVIDPDSKRKTLETRGRSGILLTCVSCGEYQGGMCRYKSGILSPQIIVEKVVFLLKWYTSIVQEDKDDLDEPARDEDHDFIFE